MCALKKSNCIVVIFFCIFSLSCGYSVNNLSARAVDKADGCTAKRGEDLVANFYLHVDHARAYASGAASCLRACVAGRFGFVEWVLRDYLR